MKTELTPRHVQVAEMLRDGLLSKQIADRLDISEKTVEKHKGALIQRLGARNSTHAVVLALRAGLISLA